MLHKRFPTRQADLQELYSPLREVLLIYILYTYYIHRYIIYIYILHIYILYFIYIYIIYYIYNNQVKNMLCFNIYLYHSLQIHISVDSHVSVCITYLCIYHLSCGFWYWKFSPFNRRSSVCKCYTIYKTNNWNIRLWHVINKSITININV